MKLLTFCPLYKCLVVWHALRTVVTIVPSSNRVRRNRRRPGGNLDYNVTIFISEGPLETYKKKQDIDFTYELDKVE